MKNQLSALIDGEFELEDSDHILTAMKSGGEVTEAWQHYHLIGDAMRGDAEMLHGFSAKVMQALDAEPTVLAVNKQTQDTSETVKPKFKIPMVWSVAASVAAVMFVGLMVMQQQLGGVDDVTLTPIEIAQNLPLEYLQAHQAAAPSGAAYYIQNASFSESQQ